MGLQAAAPSHADSPLFVLRLQLLDQAGERAFYQEEDNRFEHDATLKLLRGELYTYELRLDDLVGSIDSMTAASFRFATVKRRATHAPDVASCSSASHGLPIRQIRLDEAVEM